MSFGPEAVILFMEQFTQAINEATSDKERHLGARKDWSTPGDPAREAGHIQGLKESLVILADISAKFTRSDEEEITFND